MVLSRKKRLSALEVYNIGYFSSCDSKKFFLELRDAIICELEMYGECSFVDKFINGGIGKVDILVYAALYDIKNRYERKNMSDVEGMKYIPNIGNDFLRSCKTTSDWLGRIEWGRCMRLNFICDDIKEEYIFLARIIQNKGKEIYKSKERLDRDNLSKESVYEKVNVSKNEMVNLKNEDIHIKNGNEERMSIMSDDIQQKNTRLLINKYIYEEQCKLRKENEVAINSVINDKLDSLSELAEVYDKMCSRTKELQANWFASLDRMYEDINSMKSDLYENLRKWQIALYPNNVQALAEIYIELYQKVNIDKIICNEILFQEEYRAKNKLESIEGVPDTVLSLQKLNKSLSIFLSKFEVSLKGLGLYVYYPKEGETFDEIWHLNENEEIDADSKFIKDCVVPGIAKKASGVGEDDVIIRAIVKIME